MQKSPWTNPKVFGPVLWKLLHNTSMNYPICATEYVKNHMKNFIMSLPVITPCELCKGHASKYIEKYADQLDTICSGRDNLFAFFVDFHNQVNKRYDKPVITVEEAYKLYS